DESRRPGSRRGLRTSLADRGPPPHLETWSLPSRRHSAAIGARDLQVGDYSRRRGVQSNAPDVPCETRARSPGAGRIQQIRTRSPDRPPGTEEHPTRRCRYPCPSGALACRSRRLYEPASGPTGTDRRRSRTGLRAPCCPSPRESQQNAINAQGLTPSRLASRPLPPPPSACSLRSRSALLVWGALAPRGSLRDLSPPRLRRARSARAPRC